MKQRLARGTEMLKAGWRRLMHERHTHDVYFWAGTGGVLILVIGLIVLSGPSTNSKTARSVGSNTATPSPISLPYHTTMPPSDFPLPGDPGIPPDLGTPTPDPGSTPDPGNLPTDQGSGGSSSNNPPPTQNPTPPPTPPPTQNPTPTPTPPPTPNTDTFNGTLENPTAQCFGGTASAWDCKFPISVGASGSVTVNLTTSTAASYCVRFVNSSGTQMGIQCANGTKVNLQIASVPAGSYTATAYEPTAPRQIASFTLRVTHF